MSRLDAGATELPAERFADIALSLLSSSTAKPAWTSELIRGAAFGNAAVTSSLKATFASNGQTYLPANTTSSGSAAERSSSAPASPRFASLLTGLSASSVSSQHTASPDSTSDSLFGIATLFTPADRRKATPLNIIPLAAPLKELADGSLILGPQGAYKETIRFEIPPDRRFRRTQELQIAKPFARFSSTATSDGKHVTVKRQLDILTSLADPVQAG